MDKGNVLQKRTNQLRGPVIVLVISVPSRKATRRPISPSYHPFSCSGFLFFWEILHTYKSGAVSSVTEVKEILSAWSEIGLDGWLVLYL